MDEELYNRYDILKRNINFYLLQFMYEDSDKEFKEKNDKRFYLGYTRRKYPDIYLKIDNYNLNKIIKFMFNKSSNYDFFKCTDFKRIHNGFDLVDKKNKQDNSLDYFSSLDLSHLFSLIRNYLDSGEYDNSNDIYSLTDYEEIYSKELELISNKKLERKI